MEHCQQNVKKYEQNCFFHTTKLRLFRKVNRWAPRILNGGWGGVEVLNLRLYIIYDLFMKLCYKNPVVSTNAT